MPGSAFLAISLEAVAQVKSTEMVTLEEMGGGGGGTWPFVKTTKKKGFPQKQNEQTNNQAKDQTRNQSSKQTNNQICNQTNK